MTATADRRTYGSARHSDLVIETAAEQRRGHGSCLRDGSRRRPWSITRTSTPDQGQVSSPRS